MVQITRWNTSAVVAEGATTRAALMGVVEAGANLTGARVSVTRIVFVLYMVLLTGCSAVAPFDRAPTATAIQDGRFTAIWDTQANVERACRDVLTTPGVFVQRVGALDDVRCCTANFTAESTRLVWSWLPATGPYREFCVRHEKE